MATKKQIQANRLNAQKSTGPRSAEGKTASSQNALKSGIDAESQVIRGEDPDSLDALTAQYLRDLQPQTAAERALVDTLIDTEWLLRRMRKAEAHLWAHQFADIEERHERWHSGEPLPEDQLLGDAFQRSQETFTRLERRRDSLHRTYHRTLQDLRDLQASRPEAPTPPAKAAPTPSSQTPNSPIGFVPEDFPETAPHTQPAPPRFDPPSHEMPPEVRSTLLY